nr:hypothetical protein [Tanacetum cinerariifolium]
MRRVGKGFLRVETPLFDGMLVAEEPEEQGDAEEQDQDNVDYAAQGADTVVSEDDVQDQSIPSPSSPTPPPQQPQDFPSISQVQHTPPQPQSPPLAQPQTADFLMSLLQEALDTCVALTRQVEHLEHDKVGTSKRIESSADTDMEDASNQGRMIADLDRDTCVALMDDEGAEKKAEDAQVAGDEQVKGRQAEIYKIDMDHASKILSMQEDKPEVQEAVEVVTTAKLITEVVAAVSESVTAVEYARKLHEELNNDIDWDVAIDHVKQKRQGGFVCTNISGNKEKPQTEAQARRNMIMYLKNIPGFRLDNFKGISYDDIPQKAAKRKKLNEEVKDLKQHLEIVPDEDNDVYIEATPLARKVPVVDYQIIQLNNKPQYKIIKADGTHQLYPLSRFTLEQMLNAVRLRVEEQSEMSLELLSFGVDAAMDLEEKHKVFTAAGEEFSAAKQKLMLLDTAAERRLMLLSQDKNVNDKCCC